MGPGLTDPGNDSLRRAHGSRCAASMGPGLTDPGNDAGLSGVHFKSPASMGPGLTDPGNLRAEVGNVLQRDGFNGAGTN